MKKKVSNRPIVKKSSAPKKEDMSTSKEYKYKVESGIEINGHRTINSFNAFPFELMKPGDSFLIPANDPVAKNPNTLHYAAKQYAKMKPGFTITSRLQLNKDRRVWRLK